MNLFKIIRYEINEKCNDLFIWKKIKRIYNYFILMNIHEHQAKKILKDYGAPYQMVL